MFGYLSAAGMSSLGSQELPANGLGMMLGMEACGTESVSGSSITWCGIVSLPSRIFSTVNSTDLVTLKSSTITFRV